MFKLLPFCSLMLLKDYQMHHFIILYARFLKGIWKPTSGLTLITPFTSSVVVKYFGYLLRQVRMSDLSTLEDTVRVWHHQKWEKKCLLPITNYSLHCNSEALKPEAALWCEGKKEKNVQCVGDSTVARSGQCGVFIFTHADDNTEVLLRCSVHSRAKKNQHVCAVHSERSTPPPASRSYRPLCKTFSLLEIMCHLWPAVWRRIKLKGVISLLVDVLLREITVRLPPTFRQSPFFLTFILLYYVFSSIYF